MGRVPSRWLRVAFGANEGARRRSPAAAAARVLAVAARGAHGEERREELVHALPVGEGRVLERPDGQHAEQQRLRARLGEVRVPWAQPVARRTGRRERPAARRARAAQRARK
jgi:hypothetical protein